MNGQLAQRLYDLRRAHGLSQEELARKLAVSRQAVSKWECGDALPSTENLFALAELYEVSIETLMEDARASASDPVKPSPQAETIQEDADAPQQEASVSGRALGGDDALATETFEGPFSPSQATPRRWPIICCLGLLVVAIATFIVCCVANNPDATVIDGVVVASEGLHDDFVVDVGHGYDYRYLVISVDSNTRYYHANGRDGETLEEVESDPFSLEEGAYVSVSINTKTQGEPQAVNLAESICLIEETGSES